MVEPRVLEHLFAYGTLRPRSAPPALAHLMRFASSLGAAWVPGLLYDFGSYPGVIAPPASGSQEFRVHGEVLQLAGLESWLPELDAYEGFDLTSPATSLFVRTPCTATLRSGQALTCWIYLYRGTPPASAHIPSGRWEGRSGRS
ncbi:MAG TPA: gamma-glutamylcyclotransferase family protein [Myxococcota bacterium]|nr:gamma-glutamylcyclotransferase family protein [Myxococcota bacterium]